MQVQEQQASDKGVKGQRERPGNGERHRAGIGVTETIDVVSIIVSEETGIISVVRGGKMTRYADTEMLKKTLSKYYWQNQMGGRR